MNIRLPVCGITKYGSCDKANPLRLESVSKRQNWLDKAATNIPCFGIIMALAASVSIESAGMLVKVTQSVHGVQMAFFRALFQVIAYGIIIGLRGLSFGAGRGEGYAIFARAFFGALAVVCSYFAFELIPLNDATVIRSSMSIWTLIISYMVLNESCSFTKTFAVVISIIGVFLIAKPGSSVYFVHLMAHSFGLEDETTFKQNANQLNLIPSINQDSRGKIIDPSLHLQGSLLALSTSISLALSLVAQRMCRKSSPEVCVFWLSILIVAMASVLLISLAQFRWPTNWLDMLFIILNGACGAMGQWLTCIALRYEQAGVVSLTRTADIVVAFLYSACLIKETITVTSIVGALLVAFGVIIAAVTRMLS